MNKESIKMVSPDIRKRRILSSVLGLGILASAVMAVSPATAVTLTGENRPSSVQAVQGTETSLQWTYHIPAGTAFTFGNGPVTFNAPAGTTFPTQTTAPLAVSTDGTNFASDLPLIGCSVSGGGAQLSCNLNIPALTGNSIRLLRLSPKVSVDPAAVPGAYSAAASVQFGGGTTEANTLHINDGTLDVLIVPSASVPLVDPLVGFGTGLAVLLAGVFVVRRRRGPAVSGL